jgi:hypothetical protein
LFTAVGGGLALAVVAGTPTARAAWQELALFLSLQGRPEPALRDITGQTLPHDSAAWRTWYNSGGARFNPVTRDSM